MFWFFLVISLSGYVSIEHKFTSYEECNTARQDMWDSIRGSDTVRDVSPCYLFMDKKLRMEK